MGKKHKRRHSEPWHEDNVRSKPEYYSRSSNWEEDRRNTGSGSRTLTSQEHDRYSYDHQKYSRAPEMFPTPDWSPQKRPKNYDKRGSSLPIYHKTDESRYKRSHTETKQPKREDKYAKKHKREHRKDKLNNVSSSGEWTVTETEKLCVSKTVATSKQDKAEVIDLVDDDVEITFSTSPNSSLSKQDQSNTAKKKTTSSKTSKPVSPKMSSNDPDIIFIKSSFQAEKGKTNIVKTDASDKQSKPNLKSRRLEPITKIELSKGFDCWTLTDKKQALLVGQTKDEVKLCLQGRGRIQCIAGEIDLMGYHIKASEDKTSYPVYSPDTNSFLSATFRPTTKLKHNKSIMGFLKSQFQSEDDSRVMTSLKEISHSVTVIVIVSCLDCQMCDFVTSFSPFQHIFKPDSTAISRTVSLSRTGLHVVSASESDQCAQPNQYVYVIKDLQDLVAKGKKPRVVVCGGKNVGKSTLATMLINTMLNSTSAVAYLDCDVGQTEFTPPAFVSLSFVEKPLFGPAFTHQKKPLCQCFYGSLSVEDPDRYIKCLQHVFKEYESLDVPLIVNTMGWNKGLGVSLLIDTLHLVQPDTVIQLNSTSAGRNFPSLTCDFLSSTPGWLQDIGGEESRTLGSTNSNITKADYKLIKLTSPVNPDARSRYRPANLRELSILSYFGKIENSKNGVARLLGAQPHAMDWRTLGLHVCHADVPTSQLLCAFNCSVVAMCNLPKQQLKEPIADDYPHTLKSTPVATCMGLGLVRSIDPDNKVIYLLSPEPTDYITSVNCLLRGSTMLPDVVLTGQAIPGESPYIGFPLDTIGAPGIQPRRHMLRDRLQNDERTVDEQ